MITMISGLAVLTSWGFLYAARDTGIITNRTTTRTKNTVHTKANTGTIYNPATDVSSRARVKSDITHPYYRESRWSYDLYMSSGVYLFVLNTWLQTIWNTSGTNATTVQSRSAYDLVINGGYFTYDRSINGFLPAGRIVDGRHVIRSMVKEFWAPDLDPNLWVTMVYDRARNIMRAGAQDIIVPQVGTYAFYAGPWLINNGQTMTWISANISHRQRRAVRTFMIIDMDGKPHLWVTIQWYTLPALAAKIQEMKVFYWQYQVINMDGGSSTALAAGTRYWNSRARLPRFFGVK